MIQGNYIKEMPLSIVGGNRFGRYPKISTEETYNMLVSDGTLVPFAGYQKVADLGAVGRDIFVSTRYNHLIVVVDNVFYTVDVNNNLTTIGTLETSTGEVYIEENNAGDIAAADGKNIYDFNWVASTFTTNTYDFLPIFLAFMDTYFICPTPAPDVSVLTLSQWQISDSNTVVFSGAPTSVGTLQTKPDIVVACMPFNKQLFVFGRTVTEIFYDTGYQLFPFQQNNYYAIDYGCLNAATIAVGSIEGSQGEMIPLICWLGINEKAGATIMYSTGGIPGQLSTDGINFLIDNLTHPEIAYAFIYRQAGHTIYQITWPRDNISQAYDFNTKKFFTVTDENLNYHIAKRVAYFNNKYYFLSINDGGLYVMDDNLTTYNGAEIPRIRITPPFALPDSSAFIAPYAELTLEQGEAANDQFVDVSVSKDGGVSYSSNVRQQLNTVGKRQNKFRTRQLGAANDLRLQYRFYGLDRFVIKSGVIGVYQ